MTSSEESNETLSSTMTMTSKHDVTNTTFIAVSTAFLNANTTSHKNIKSSTKLQKTPKSSTIQSTTSITPLKKPLSTQKSSSPTILYLILIILFIGIIGVIIFLVFYYRKKQNSNILSRNNSDESYDSVATESDINPSSEYNKQTIPKHALAPLEQLEQSKMSNTTSRGRIFTHLDPDTL